MNEQVLELTQVRKARGLTKAELARQARMGESILGLIERGRYIPYDSQLAKIAAALAWERDPRELLAPAGSFTAVA